MIRMSFLCLGLAGLCACAPPGYETAGYTAVRWPTQDTPLSIEQRAEVEGRLKALGYLKGQADAVITTESRSAIRRYQADIGAPSSGFVSAVLLDSLRVNTAYLSAADIRSLSRNGRATATPRRVPQTQTSAPSATGTPPLVPAPGGGGSGGGGGGAWN